MHKKAPTARKEVSLTLSDRQFKQWLQNDDERNNAMIRQFSMTHVKGLPSITTAGELIEESEAVFQFLRHGKILTGEREKTMHLDKVKRA